MVLENIIWNNFFNVQEMVVYRLFNDYQIFFEQVVKIIVLCGGWQKIKNSMEDVFVKRFCDNVVRGKEGFEVVFVMSRRVFVEEQQWEKMMFI